MSGKNQRRKETRMMACDDSLVLAVSSFRGAKMMQYFSLFMTWQIYFIFIYCSSFIKIQKECFEKR